MPIQILGVNSIGSEIGNPGITQGRDLPWLQDVVTEDVFTSWQVVYYDVVVLDGDNTVVSVFNLQQNDLSDPVNYAALRTILYDAAAGGCL